MKINLLGIFVLIFFCSCRSGVNSLDKELNQQLQEYYSALLSQYSHIVIIPRTGCHSCVNEADLFFQKNKTNKSYLFIFTKLVSEKQLRIELGSESLSRENVKIDKLNHFCFPEFIESEYPLLLEKQSDGNYKYEVLQ